MLRILIAAALSALVAGTAHASDDPDLIFKKTTVFRFFSPDAKLAVYAIDDPKVEGVSCHFTLPEIGGWKGWAGLADEASNASIVCQQIGPISFKARITQGEEAFRERRSLFFKKVQIVRGCDVKRNVLVYLIYTDRLIEGSPQNSTSSVPIAPWGDSGAPSCQEFLD